MSRTEAEDYLNRLCNGLGYLMLESLDATEPLEGDARWESLSRYGYDKPEYTEDEEVA
jgi:hypothetical protein